MKRRTFLAAGVASAAAPALGSSAPSATIRLVNPRWSVRIDPRSLAIEVEPVGASAVTLSCGSTEGPVSGLETDGHTASWHWGEDFEVVCQLAGPDLHVDVTAKAPGELTLLNQPSAAMGKGLLLPISEGYFVAQDDANWHASLEGEALSVNEDLSLPLWGVDHGAFTLHWMCVNPFNNTLSFTANSDGLAVTLRHHFIRLAPETPMAMTLHLAGPDLLAGAKRYRRHLIEQGSFRSLADKIGATPSATKLLGATHLYLWDNGLVGIKDVRDWPGLLDRLRSAPGLPERMRATFDSDSAELLRSAPADPAAYATGTRLRGKVYWHLHHSRWNRPRPKDKAPAR